MARKFNYPEPFTSFPQVRGRFSFDVVNPMIVRCELCEAIRGQRCTRTAPGVEFHRVRWVDALTADR